MLTLNGLIIEYKKGNKDAFIDIVNIFRPILNKYKKNSYYEDIDSELILFMMTILEKLTIKEEFEKDDKYTFSYISKALKNKYIRVNQKHYNKYSNESVEYETLNYSTESSIDGEVLFKDMIKNLNQKERDIINKYYIWNLCESDIAREFNTSRQYINKVHKKALLKLKNSYNKEYLN